MISTTYGDRRHALALVRADRFFYCGMAFAAIVAVFIGFSGTYYLRSRFQDGSLALYLQVHGAAFSAWMMLFLTQTSLVAARRTDVHRRLGWAGAALALFMVVIAITAAILSGRRNFAAGLENESLTFLTTPFFSMVVFLALVATAVNLRRAPETHKRLMLLATISILDAATARWPIAIVQTSSWAYYGFADLFIAAAIAYDLVSRRRIHPAYVWGGLVIVVSQYLRDVIGQTEAWHSFARSILG
jgi:hypothetical protein